MLGRVQVGEIMPTDGGRHQACFRISLPEASPRAGAGADIADAQRLALARSTTGSMPRICGRTVQHDGTAQSELVEADRPQVPPGGFNARRWTKFDAGGASRWRRLIEDIPADRYEISSCVRPRRRPQDDSESGMIPPGKTTLFRMQLAATTRPAHRDQPGRRVNARLRKEPMPDQVAARRLRRHRPADRRHHERPGV
jgi:hypothetical protein